MAYDALSILQTLVTKTASFTGAGFDLKTGTPRRGMDARFLISAYSSTATAGAVFTPAIYHSDDNTTFTLLSAAPPITAATAAATSELFIHFMTRKRYIASNMTLTTSSGVPSISYLCDLGNAQP